MFKSFSFSFVTSGAYCVDIFFWMTGFLGAYLMLATMKKKNGRLQNPLMIMLHRFLRLVPLYAVTMMLYWFIMPVVGNGPIFFRMKTLADD